eukprot:6214305-Pleurochrysis_carterae.AAC.1
MRKKGMGGAGKEGKGEEKLADEVNYLPMVGDRIQYAGVKIYVWLARRGIVSGALTKADIEKGTALLADAEEENWLLKYSRDAIDPAAVPVVFGKLGTTADGQKCPAGTLCDRVMSRSVYQAHMPVEAENLFGESVQVEGCKLARLKAEERKAERGSGEEGEEGEEGAGEGKDNNDGGLRRSKGELKGKTKEGKQGKKDGEANLSGVPRGLALWGKYRLDHCTKEQVLHALIENGFSLPPLTVKQKANWAKDQL